MNLQYHVDLIATIMHERHAALLAEAETERLFAQQPASPARLAGLQQALAQLRCHVATLRAHLLHA